MLPGHKYCKIGGELTKNSCSDDFRSRNQCNLEKKFFLKELNELNYNYIDIYIYLIVFATAAEIYSPGLPEVTLLLKWNSQDSWYQFDC